MKEIYKEAFVEVNEIINMMPIKLKEKIPQTFINIIKEEKSDAYVVSLKEPLENEVLKDETIAILALIYRDFLCSEEKRIYLKKQDEEEIKKLETLLQEKYNVDLFANKRKVQEENISMVVHEDKWYKRIWNWIKKLVKKD